MKKVVYDSADHKIVLDVEEGTSDEGNTISFTAFCFFWKGPFRAIYDNNSEKFTVWKLDQKTGIWGCFADAHDVGFDYSTRVVDKLREALDKNEANPNLREQIEIALLFEFVELARLHTNKLFATTLVQMPTFGAPAAQNSEDDEQPAKSLTR